MLLTLCSCKMSDRTRMNMIVVVAENGDEHHLDVDLMHHVSDVKDHMQHVLGLPARRQALYFNNAELMDATELAFLGHDNARTTLVINQEENRFDVIVRMETTEIIVEVEEMDSVRQLKEKIYQRTAGPHGQRVVLHHEGVEMTNRRRLCRYGVGMNSEIIATFQP